MNGMHKDQPTINQIISTQFRLTFIRLFITFFKCLHSPYKQIAFSLMIQFS